MISKKPDHIKDEIWAQHLRWIDLISNECKSNQMKREDQKLRRASKTTKTA